MGNIINFMEKLGASAEFQELSEAEVLEMLQQQQLVNDKPTNFHSAVEMLLDPRKNLVCGVAPAEEPADEPADEPEEDTPDDELTK
ncbi:MAG: hypothetical protein KKE30_20850 [Gammaproteobacteria bacterium]|nr:hypothetical protein [Gammaproteobacteria bacterium]MBU1556574.1 hypothetical protein [Gammaproteobacteria bacterium]MBU2072614.1 hypothetical protein [Gammaproteobacteria bacterium]MBU2182252.1 hypothetical protein [Gammaproteobacteria bacterium]MBU2207168.1 hypothetical protein [Gammaproteobacteria bacterium]